MEEGVFCEISADADISVGEGVSSETSADDDISVEEGVSIALDPKLSGALVVTIKAVCNGDDVTMLLDIEMPLEVTVGNTKTSPCETGVGAIPI